MLRKYLTKMAWCRGWGLFGVMVLGIQSIMVEKASFEEVIFWRSHIALLLVSVVTCASVDWTISSRFLGRICGYRFLWNSLPLKGQSADQFNKEKTNHTYASSKHFLKHYQQCSDWKLRVSSLQCPLINPQQFQFVVCRDKKWHRSPVELLSHI